METEELKSVKVAVKLELMKCISMVFSKGHEGALSLKYNGESKQIVCEL